MTVLLFLLVGNGETRVWYEDTSAKVFNWSEIQLYESFGRIEVGLRFLIDNETIENKEKFLGFYQRYVQYKTDNYYLIAGNFYKIFGSGLLFAAYEDREMFIDKYLDGLSAGFDFTSVDGGVFVAPLISNYKAMVYGLELHPLIFSLYYIRFDVADTSGFFGYPYEEWIGIGGSKEFGRFEAGIEYAKRFVWGEYSPAHGWYGVENKDGRGVYGYCSFVYKDFGIYADFKDYIRVDGEMNLPPPCTFTGESLNQGRDEKGGEVEINFKFPSSFHHIYNAGYIEDHKRSSSLLTFYSEERIETEVLTVVLELFSVKRNTKESFLPISGEKKASFKLEGSIGDFSFTMHIGAGDVEEGILKYKEFETIFEVGRGDFILSTGAEYTTSPPTGENRTNWYWVGIQWQYFPFFLLVEAGGFRGKYTCKGGICRYEPPFKGLKINFSFTL